MLRRLFCLLPALLLLLPCALGEEAPAEELPVYPPMEYDLDIPGKRVYDTYVSDTLRFTIETFHMEGNKCVLTEVWVQDPGRQIRKVNADWGKDLANPLATILSAAMLLRFSFGAEVEAKAIESAVDKVLSDGWRTGDIAGKNIDAVKAAGKLVGTKKMGQLVVEYLSK